MAKKFKCSISTIAAANRKMGLSRLNIRTSPEVRLKIILMMEDFWCNNKLTNDLALIYGLSTPTVSRYTRNLFPKQLTKDTEIRVFQSKV